MTLIICSECNKRISDKSEKCIGCGAPIEVSISIKKNINADNLIDENTIENEIIPELTPTDNFRVVLSFILIMFGLSSSIQSISETPGNLNHLSYFLAFIFWVLVCCFTLFPFRKLRKRKNLGIDDWKIQRELIKSDLKKQFNYFLKFLIRILTILIKFTHKYKLINDNIVSLKKYIMDIEKKND